MSENVAERVEKLEEGVFGTHPENPGVVIRLDRVERLLSTMLKVGAVVGGMGLLWKVVEVVGEVTAAALRGP